MDKPIREWGPGVPDYSKSDLLEGTELHAFCTDAAARWMKENGYTIEGVIVTRMPTQVIAERAGKRVFVIVAGGIYPFEGRISYEMKRQYAEYCQSQNAVPMFCSVGIMSDDAERAKAGLALKYDGYRIKVTEPEDISQVGVPVVGDKDYKAYCVGRIIRAYATGRFEDIFDLFAEDIQFHTQWVLETLSGKEAVTGYFIGKGKTLRSHEIKIDGSVVMIKNGHKVKGNVVYISSPGDICGLLSQELDGETIWILICPTFDQSGKLCDLALIDPALASFIPYYAFQG